MELKCTNVNQVLSECLYWLKDAGVEEQSRNGPVLVSPEPVTVTYLYPTERVLFSPLRNANPFFHLMESLWMIAGRNDLAWPLYFNKNFASYSDNGETVHGAYGHRWRKALGFDQLAVIAKELQSNSESRRCVLQMWDATPYDEESPWGRADLFKAIKGGKDVPCNTHAYFDLRDGALNMTVCNRSNDLIWGLAGANAVHFSVLQEYLAAWIGAPIGVYRQFTNNLHAYTAIVGERAKLGQLAQDAASNDLYPTREVTTLPLVKDFDRWNKELERFMAGPVATVNWLYTEPFFRDVAVPMYAAWHERRSGGLNGADQVAKIKATDWHRACAEWVARRAAKVKATQNA